LFHDLSWQFQRQRWQRVQSWPSLHPRALLKNLQPSPAQACGCPTEPTDGQTSWPGPLVLFPSGNSCLSLESFPSGSGGGGVKPSSCTFSTEAKGPCTACISGGVLRGGTGSFMGYGSNALLNMPVVSGVQQESEHGPESSLVDGCRSTPWCSCKHCSFLLSLLAIISAGRWMPSPTCKGVLAAD